MTELSSVRVEADDVFEAIELYFRNGWTDGLPVVPPTESRVAEFLEACGHSGGDIVGQVPERRRTITAEKLAINAVMAGCLPEYMPVVLAAFQAMCDPEFNLHGSTVTTGGPAPLLIVNGPIARRLGMNAGVSLFGPGWRPNATIGRAIRLILINCCGTEPGVMDKATIGHPGKYTYCIAEDEENCPWEPLHAMRGFEAADSAVTVFAADAPKLVSNEGGTTPEAILDTIAGTIKDPGAISVPATGDFLVVHSPQHRGHMIDHGWTKRDIQEYLFEKTKLVEEDYYRGGRRPMRARTEREWPVPTVEKPDDFMIMAGGGPAGGFSAVVTPWWGRVSRAVTRKIEG
jgi:hypothetical protein